MDQREKSSDVAVQEMISKAATNNIETVFDRYQQQQPQCGFGTLGLCCRFCWKGPCRIDPFGAGPQRGICGADRHTIVARQLARMMAAGAGAHSEHGRHILHAMRQIVRGEVTDIYNIKDEAKLLACAERMDIKTEGRAIMSVASDVVDATYDDFGNQEDDNVMNWLRVTLPQKRIDRLQKLGVLAPNIDMAVCQTVARTAVGCDADPANIIMGGIRAALCDFDGMALATEMSDILFGTPSPIISEANLGVINENSVNIAVNGHNPLVAEAVCLIAGQMQEQAKALGAKDGINIVGVCCTGNESMLRHGVPMAGNYLSQEMVLVTGAIDAMVVDVQCIMPGIVSVAENFHTVIITTHDENKIPGAVHRSVHADNAREAAEGIVKLALDAYTRRNPTNVLIPDNKETCIVGFSAEAIMLVLERLNAEDPLKPLIDAIVGGQIKGIALFAGCNTTQVDQDKNFKEMGRELAKRDVLLLATGCGAGAFAKDGLMTQEAVEEFAGPGLKSVLTTLGEAAGLNGPLPLVFHMGSCVDNSRAVMIATAIAEKLGVDLSDLPVVASAPEAMAEKAVAIGSWSVALGFPTHLGNIPQIMGSDAVVELVTETSKELFGGYFVVDPDPISAAETLYEAILERRKGLGI
ncbi:anaerobic carbon-monoxide dehydrogenase catalytic subunit [Pseudovibrio sp. POLY-S9]|uniref:anaerobic carbon-monoxide dehydrogenase catalytic subunit n=1 Tax=Pseudovibrio sp. POLY-S9 TaxID=1576596 RepID=UPI000710DCFB|nr:anaerobic carbon-monoxide dehydrogenase catalytic subunit [Pseudovibrio sp. POLY-S9]